MGLVALPAQQFWQRLLLFFMQPAKYPETPYTVFMESDRVHLYTMIEATWIAPKSTGYIYVLRWYNIAGDKSRWTLLVLKIVLLLSDQNFYLVIGIMLRECR